MLDKKELKVIKKVLKAQEDKSRAEYQVLDKITELVKTVE